MTSVKRRRVSYLSPTELALALIALDKFQSSIEVVDVDLDEGPAGPDDVLLSDLDNIISKLHSRLGQPQRVDLPGSEDQILGDLKIERTSDLMLKHDYEKAICIEVEAGKNQQWSSSAMYAHLTMLENSVQAQDEVGASLWINTFFFRVSAMVPPSHRVIFQPQRNPPSVLANPRNLRATYTGYIYYTVVITLDEIAPFHMERAGILSAKTLKNGFFVIEANEMGAALSNHLPQALCELYACAEFLEQPVIRGALTNGRRWIFIILCMNENEDGARYKTSGHITYTVSEDNETGEAKILDNGPDLIAGILLHWVQNSGVDIGEEDLFYEFTMEKR